MYSDVSFPYLCFNWSEVMFGSCTFNKFYVDLSLDRSQPKFLPTEFGKLWKAINAKQKQIVLMSKIVLNLLYKAINHGRSFI